MTDKLTDNERQVLAHVSMWGSDGYPVRKLGSRWVVGDFFGVNGPPTMFKTKRAAVAQFELFLSVLREKAGEEAFERAFADRVARYMAAGLTAADANTATWADVQAARERDAA